MFSMDALPQELLERVLAWLPVADLVVDRVVCQRWRSAIANLARADAPFAFTCGLNDLLRNAPWLQRERARMLATQTAGEADTRVADALNAILDRSFDWSLPCTCGAPQNFDDPGSSSMRRH